MLVWMLLIFTALSTLFNLVQCILLLGLIGDQLSLKRRLDESGIAISSDEIEALTKGDATGVRNLGSA